MLMRVRDVIALLGVNMVFFMIMASCVTALIWHYFSAKEALHVGSEKISSNTSSDNADIMKVNLEAIEQCQPRLKANFDISMTDIHSTNPYKNFSPSSYGIKGRDLTGWGIDPAHAKIIDTIRPKFMVEVGSWKGLSATKFAKQMRQHYSKSMHNDECIMLICVDTWLGATTVWENTDMEHPALGQTLYLRNGYPSVYYQFLYNIIDEHVEDIVVPLPLPGVMGAIFLNRKNARPDTIFIDGCHDEICVRQDLESWFPLLSASGAGILFGDDYIKKKSKGRLIHFVRVRLDVPSITI
eukprot:452327_1